MRPWSRATATALREKKNDYELNVKLKLCQLLNEKKKMWPSDSSPFLSLPFWSGLGSRRGRIGGPAGTEEAENPVKAEKDMLLNDKESGEDALNGKGVEVDDGGAVDEDVVGVNEEDVNERTEEDVEEKPN